MTAKITKIGLTNDKISGRGGLAFFLRCIEKIGLYSLISSVILKDRLEKKGRKIVFPFQFCFLNKI